MISTLMCSMIASVVVHTALGSEDEQLVSCHALVKEWENHGDIESDGEYDAPQLEEPLITENHTFSAEQIAFPEGSDWGPFKVPKRKESMDDMTVYASLVQMFRGLLINSSIRCLESMDWYQFIQNAIETNNASIQTLCDRYSNFICERGKLTCIRLNSLGLQGIFNVSSVPSSVCSLILHRNLLTGISGLDQLDGKKLHYLNVMQNPLNINLKPLEKSSATKGNPLRILCVTKCQIAQYFLGIPHDQYQGSQQFEAVRLEYAASEWINLSILESIFFRARNGHRKRLQNSK